MSQSNRRSRPGSRRAELFSLAAVTVSAIALGACARIGREGRGEISGPQPAGGGRADVHVHLVMRSGLRAFQGGVDGPILATSPDQFWVNQLTTEGFQRAGISLVVAACWPPFALRPGRTAMDETLGQARALNEFVRTHAGFGIARSTADARRLIGGRLIAVIPQLEGAEAIRRVSDVDILYAAGFRAIGLVHFTDNGIADAHDGQFGSLLAPILNGKDGGLTPLGREAIRRMIELGMLIDLGHTSARTREDVLAITERARVPVLYSHEGPDWGAPRLLGEGSGRKATSRRRSDDPADGVSAGHATPTSERSASARRALRPSAGSSWVAWRARRGVPPRVPR